MTNIAELTQELGIDDKQVGHLLNSCGMTEDDHELDILQAVAKLRADKAADNYTHAWCLHIAQTHEVELQPIHKAIIAEGIETGDDLYHPLFVLTCEKVAEGMDPVEAVKLEMSEEAMEYDAEFKPSIEDIEQLDDDMKQALKAESMRTARKVAQNARKTSSRVVAAAHQFHMKQLRHDLQEVFAEEWAKQGAQQAIEGQAKPGKLLEAEVTAEA